MVTLMWFSRVPCAKHDFLQEWSCFIGDNLLCQREEVDKWAKFFRCRDSDNTEQMGVLSIKVDLPRMSLWAIWSISSLKWNYQMYNNWSKMLFFQFTTDGLWTFLVRSAFLMIQRLCRSYKLSGPSLKPGTDRTGLD